jgi:hypothetical protein
MKIALCLSGQARGLEKAYEYVNRNLLSCNDVDVFCHVWGDGSLVEKLYSPRKILVEYNDVIKINKNYNDYNPNHHTKNTAFNTFSMFYSIMKSNELKTSHEQKNNKKYDIVIRSRYDYAIARNINFLEYDSERIWTPVVKLCMPDYFLCNDQFAFSNSSNMNVYSAVYDNIDLYHSSGVFMVGEAMLAEQLKRNGLSQFVSYIDMWDPFFGGTYNYGPHSLVRDDMQSWIKK